jgi:hypothetical protein
MDDLTKKVYQFLLSLPKIKLPLHTYLYHGTDQLHLSVDNTIKLFFSKNSLEATRHAFRKVNEKTYGRAYIHKFRLKETVTLMDFAQISNVKRLCKWETINKMLGGTHLTNYQLENMFYGILKQFPELVGYHDPYDQGVVLFGYPVGKIEWIDVQCVKSVTYKNKKIKFKPRDSHTIQKIYMIYCQYYDDLYIKKTHPSPFVIDYTHQ